MIEPQSHPNFPELEEKVSQFWQDLDVSKKYRTKNENAPEKFRFLDGPITANNPMGVHHAHGRTIKDFYQRYHNHLGEKQRFQNGFDCQGLWVEVEVEKELGFNSKHDIETFGLAEFSRACRARVEKFSLVQAEQSRRLGMFMDWDNSYYTMSENNNLHIWHFLKKIHEKGWLYKGIDAMPWCTRCGTAISQHELSDGGYKDVTHKTVYVRFPVVGGGEFKKRLFEQFELDQEKKLSFLIWTTTPWTLLANSAVAYNPEVEYVLIEQNSEYLILAKNRVHVLQGLGEYKVISEFIGKHLNEFVSVQAEKLYEHPFANLDIPAKSADLRLIEWSDVSDQDGTGFVHIAPSAGKEDFDLGKVNGLNFSHASIDEFGVYVDGFGEFSGQSVFDVKERIIELLQKKNILYKTEPITHSYPHCWRCKHELVFRTTEEWFIKADEIRPLMKEAAKNVNWMPEFAGKRMQDWLDNMGDWPISRKRYWGLALPFYQSEDKKHFIVVESKDELRELALKPELVDQLPELHRPWIDDIELDGAKIWLNDEKQTGIWKRVKDVGDCWLDAGIVPFSTVNYLSDKTNWQGWYPFEFITEYVAQIKLWFYATLFMSVALTMDDEDGPKAPWKNVLATGFLVDEKGAVMHKSAGNMIPFDEAASKAGADAIRWLYLRERTANHHGTGNLRFGYTVLEDVRRRFLGILWNTYRFFVQNAICDNWSPDDFDPEHKSNSQLDRWLISRFEEVKSTVTEALNNYDSPYAIEAIEPFVVNDLSQWYIRRSRDRVGPTVNDKVEKDDFYQTFYLVFHQLVNILAPFVPFVTEEIFQNIKRKSDPPSVHLTNWPKLDPSLINAKLTTEMELIRLISERAHAQRKHLGLKVRQVLASATILYSGQIELMPELKSLLADEINVKGVMFKISENADVSVELDTNITPELKQEGELREFVRLVQSMRRTAGYSFAQPISLAIAPHSAQIDNFLNFAEESIKQQLLVTEIVDNIEDPDVTEEGKVNEESVAIAIRPV